MNNKDLTAVQARIWGRHCTACYSYSQTAGQTLQCPHNRTRWICDSCAKIRAGLAKRPVS